MKSNSYYLTPNVLIDRLILKKRLTTQEGRKMKNISILLMALFISACSTSMQNKEGVLVNAASKANKTTCEQRCYNKRRSCQDKGYPAHICDPQYDSCVSRCR